jgi:hypothetical protein
LTAHYTDEGVLPRSALPADFPWSPHLLNGSAAFQAALFVVAGLFAIALLVGYRTLLATLVSWFLLISLHNRNLAITQGGDVLLRMLLFWGLFLPLDERWSVDAARLPKTTTRGERAFSVGTAALTLQVCFMYWFAVALKSDPVWRSEGSAVYYALHIEQLVTPLGKYLLGFPQLLKILTFATLAIEAIGPLLLFVPVFTGPIRTAVVVMFILFHLVGLGLCLELGPFPYVCAVAWLALLPTWFWERKWVVSAGHWLQTRLANLNQSFEATSGQVEELEQSQSIGEAAASGQVASSDPGQVGPSPSRPPLVTAPLLLNVIAGLFLAYVFLWNVRSIDPQRYGVLLPQQLTMIADSFCLDQMWRMFAPTPPKEDGWYVIEGELFDGQRVDVLNSGAPVVWQQPKLVSATYPNERWRKYMLNLSQPEYETHRAHYLQYLRREWDEEHAAGLQLKRIRLYFMLLVTPPINKPPSPPRRILLCELNCSEM